MNAIPAVFILMVEACGPEGCPCLFEGDILHAIQNVIGHLGPAIRKPVSMPVGRVLDHILSRKKTFLRSQARRERQEGGSGQNASKDSLHRLPSSVTLSNYYFSGSNHGVPEICAFFATSSFISTPIPGRSGGVT